jgi:DNA-binding transcriptional LysR family regulator
VDWNDLRHFLAAYRQRSLAGAARELRCEHTTVGRRLAALEAALGTRLFTRTPDGLAPTAAADELCPLAVEVERQIQAIERRAAGHDQRVEGVVRVTASEGFTPYVIQQVAALRARHPGLRVEVLSENRALDVARGEVDLALRMAPTTHRDLIVRKLCELPWTMYASDAYVARRGVPAPIDDLRGHDVVGFDDALATVPGATWLAAHGAGATIVFRGNSLLAVAAAARIGMGLTVLPCQVAEAEPGLRRLAPDVLGTRTLSLVVHPDLARVARVRAVMDFLAEVIARDRAQMTGEPAIADADQ